MMSKISFRQRGMTAIGFVILLLIVAFITMIALKVTPIYLENFKVKSSLKSLQDDSTLKGQSRREIENMLMKRLSINDVTSVGSENVTITNDGGSIVVEVDYDVRKEVLGNIDIIATFNESIELAGN